jgi:multiple sugar transport system permease protein
MVRNSLSTRPEIMSSEWVWFPQHLQWQNFAELFAPGSAVPQGLLNSAIIAVLQVALQLAVSAAAGYGLARIPYKHRNAVFAIFLATMMVPTAVTFVPSFAVISALGWVSTLIGIILPGVFSVFSVFLFRQFFIDFPDELEEAGRLDGLGPWGVFLRIVLPNAKGITVALGAIGFINSWNAFLWPLVVGQDEGSWTIQVAISSYLNSYKIDFPVLFAASVVAILPLVILFFIFQRHIVEGVKMSGMK